ncbi:hypothetical protein SynMINOS11_02048 [Synechococcus sp. Minos11]|nr:hypothetical protein SynMINOS11_02048 [Synechococcus sp. Minos11]
MAPQASEATAFWKLVICFKGVVESLPDLFTIAGTLRGLIP